MGAGGNAPPVKSEDVMILIGSSLLLLIFILQTWSTPSIISCDEESGVECETFTVKYDLSEGDIFTLEVKEGSVRPIVDLPTGEIKTNNEPVSSGESWEYEAENSGVHRFNFEGLEESEIDYDLSRGILFDYALYPIGLAILLFGLLKKRYDQESEPEEAILED